MYPTLREFINAVREAESKPFVARSSKILQKWDDVTPIILLRSGKPFIVEKIQYLYSEGRFKVYGRKIGKDNKPYKRKEWVYE